MLPCGGCYELVYLPIQGGFSLTFPCDKSGAVEMNDLSDSARDYYLLARALVGRDFYAPTVVRMKLGGRSS